MKLIDVPERHLPPDFADRLVRSLRRRKRARRMRAIAILAAVGILGTVLVAGFCGKEDVKQPTEARLVATHDASTNDTQITSLLMLGFFRECFKRNKTGKKKEED